uniref:Integrase catalytic domain-containing protein n=1 Tax=Tanacetum cinerariifolium TaxID=118510 RepID=A0A6L2KIR6_TANCI|nr:hypothetical protein [Tanacetum cinerariifolium]
MHVLYGFEFKVERLGDHTFEVEPQENVDQGAGLQKVQTQDLMDYQSARNRDQHLACELFGYREDSNEATFVMMDARSDVYVLSNGCRKYSDDNDGYYWEYTPGLLDNVKINVLGMKIVGDQSGNTLRVSQSSFTTKNSQEYKMVYTRLDIASADLGMLDKFDHGFQTDVQVFVDLDYNMRRSITVMSRSITGYGLMILGCVRSLKDNLQHMEALSTTKARYITFTEAKKKEIWLKGLLIESGYELSLVAGIASGVLVKGGSRSKVPAQVEVVVYRMSVVYVLTTHIPEDGENATMEQIRKRNKLYNDDYVSKGLILNVMEQYNELLGILGRFTQHKMNMDEAIQDSDKLKGNNVDGHSVVNMIKHNNSFMYNDNKGKRKHQDTKADPNKKSKVTCWKCGKLGHLKKDHKGGKVGDKANGSGTNGSVNGSFNSLKDLNMFRETVHVCKDRYWFKTYESLNNGSILYMGNESTALVHGRGYVDLRFSYGKIVSLFNVLHVPNIRKNLVLCSILNNYENKKYFVTFIDDASRFCYVYLLHTKDEALDKFKVFKTGIELQQRSLIKIFRTNRGCEYIDTLYFQSVGIIHETIAPYSPKQNGISKRKNRVLKEMVNPMLSYSGLSQRAVVRLPDPKLKMLYESGIECIFVGYAEHSKAFRLYVIEPNESVSINFIIESSDVIFDENRFSLVPIPSQRSLINGTEYIGDSVVPEEVTKEVDGTIEKFKARLVIQGFRQKPRIDYFDTYALVARISTIRLLIDMASIHNMIIHQMDVKITFLNCELDEETPNKFDESGKGVIIFLYVDDMLIFGTNKVQVDLPKEFLSSKFTMKDMREADVILGVRIKHKSNKIEISQSHYIEKVLKKFYYFDCTPMSTPIDTSKKLMTNNGQDVSQLEYSRVIGYLMCVMTCTRPDIDFVVGKMCSSTMESEFVALTAADKEDEWLRNLILEIPLWSKPIAHISICFDNDPTLAKAYSQMGCNGLRGKASKFGVVVACGGGVAFGYDGEVVVLRFNVTLTSCGGEVVVVLVGEDSLDDLRLMWLDGLTLIRVVCRLTWVEDEAKLRVAKYRNLQSKNRRIHPSTSCCQTTYSRYHI